MSSVLFMKKEISKKATAASILKKPWTNEEDDRLRACVELNGTSNWSIVAEAMCDRSGKQCRERWHNHLTPTVNKGAWTEEEDRIIIAMQEKIGNQWAKITKLLPGRSDNAVKNRYHMAMRARHREAKDQMVDAIIDEAKLRQYNIDQDCDQDCGHSSFSNCPISSLDTIEGHIKHEGGALSGASSPIVLPKSDVLGSYVPCFQSFPSPPASCVCSPNHMETESCSNLSENGNSDCVYYEKCSGNCVPLPICPFPTQSQSQSFVAFPTTVSIGGETLPLAQVYSPPSFQPNFHLQTQTQNELRYQPQPQVSDGDVLEAWLELDSSSLPMSLDMELDETENDSAARQSLQYQHQSQQIQQQQQFYQDQYQQHSYSYQHQQTSSGGACMDGGLINVVQLEDDDMLAEWMQDEMQAAQEEEQAGAGCSINCGVQLGWGCGVGLGVGIGMGYGSRAAPFAASVSMNNASQGLGLGHSSNNTPSISTSSSSLSRSKPSTNSAWRRFGW